MDHLTVNQLRNYRSRKNGLYKKAHELGKFGVHVLVLIGEDPEDIQNRLSAFTASNHAMWPPSFDAIVAKLEEHKQPMDFETIRSMQAQQQLGIVHFKSLDEANASTLDFGSVPSSDGTYNEGCSHISTFGQADTCVGSDFKHIEQPAQSYTTQNLNSPPSFRTRSGFVDRNRVEKRKLRRTK